MKLLMICTWLMLTDVKHIKKSLLCVQGSFVTLTNVTYEQTADLSLYTWYKNFEVYTILLQTAFY